jgi:hypothetical protein
MKQKFMAQFNIIRMTNKCLVVEDKDTLERAFIHRNAFNALDNAVEYRVIPAGVEPGPCGYIEVLTWQRF